MKDMLSQGRVPSAPILGALRKYVEEQGTETPMFVVEGIAARSGIPFSTLESWYYGKNRTPTMRFQIADSLLCAVGMWHLWYYELSDIYQNVDLTWRKCACPGCEVWFRPKYDYAGPTAPRFCSKTCKTTNCRIEAGQLRSRQKKAGREGVCWKGHKMVGKNLRILANGDRSCRQCFNEKQRLRRANRSPEQKAKNAAYHRAWREKQRKVAA